MTKKTKKETPTDYSEWQSIRMSAMGRVQWSHGLVNGVILVPCYSDTHADEITARARQILNARWPGLAHNAIFKFLKKERP